MYFNLSKEIFRICQILYLIDLMLYFKGEIGLVTAIIDCLIIVTSLSFCASLHHIFYWNSIRYGMQVQTAISGMLYKKVIACKTKLDFTLNIMQCKHVPFFQNKIAFQTQI
jgi:hypothetical protein